MTLASWKQHAARPLSFAFFAIHRCSAHRQPFCTLLGDRSAINNMAKPEEQPKDGEKKAEKPEKGAPEVRRAQHRHPIATRMPIGGDCDTLGGQPAW